MTDHKPQLQSQLWNIANILRGNMGADEFRDYILGFIFFKFLSERMESFANDILEGEDFKWKDLGNGTAFNDEAIAVIEKESVEALGYFIAPSNLFSIYAELSSTADVGNSSLLEDIESTFSAIEMSTYDSESKDDFDKLFEDIDLASSRLGSSTEDKTKLIAKVLVSLNKLDFDIDNPESDILGDAYEYLISQFASGAGKKAGEFYTPKEVSTILAKIVTTGKKKINAAYDPTCGSGSLLLRVNEVLKSTSTEQLPVRMIYGQEMNRTTFNLARMNLLMHGRPYKFFDIQHGNTLESPEHGSQLFDAIVANPPFSAKWSADPLIEGSRRFEPYGKMAPASKADYAFITHMLHHLHPQEGTLAVVLPHGALFRGAAEGHIRKHILEQNWLDAVIGLPANIFYGTSIPTCIMVFKKNRSNDDAVLFIDASNEFEKQKNQNYLNAEHIDKIVQTYRDREVLDKYSYNATLEEIRENDYNLNIPRYVDTFEEEEPVDLKAVQEEIKEIDAELAKVEEELSGYLKELGL